jgi:hypothetical protein
MVGIEAGGEGIKPEKHAARFKVVRWVCCRDALLMICRMNTVRFNTHSVPPA